MALHLACPVGTRAGHCFEERATCRSHLVAVACFSCHLELLLMKWGCLDSKSWETEYLQTPPASRLSHEPEMRCQRRCLFYFSACLNPWLAKAVHAEQISQFMNAATLKGMAKWPCTSMKKGVRNTYHSLFEPFHCDEMCWILSPKGRDSPSEARNRVEGRMSPQWSRCGVALWRSSVQPVE